MTDKGKDREYLDYLRDIRKAVDKAIEFTEGMKYESFHKDEKTVYATLRALEVIGEASKKVPDSIKDTYPEVPWREMAGIRDKLIHDYFGVNREVVWNTVQRDIPSLRPHIQQIISDQRTD